MNLQEVEKLFKLAQKYGVTRFKGQDVDFVIGAPDSGPLPTDQPEPYLPALDFTQMAKFSGEE